MQVLSRNFGINLYMTNLQGMAENRIIEVAVAVMVAVLSLGAVAASSLVWDGSGGLGGSYWTSVAVADPLQLSQVRLHSRWLQVLSAQM